MPTYKQDTKEKSRILLWNHAVRSLTQGRMESRVLNPSYLDNLWDYIKNRFEESGYLDPHELSDVGYEDWKRFGETVYGQRKPEDLKVAFFCGPEPENDVNHLIRLGVRVENIYAFESDKSLFRAAVDSLHHTFPNLKIFRGNITEFLGLNEVKFDIIYLDFTGTFMTEFRTIFKIIESNVLSDLGILILNTTYPDKTDKNVDFLTQFYLYSRCFEYSAIHGYDDEYLKSGSVDCRFVEGCGASGYSEEGVREMVDEHFECAYSAFQTRMVLIYANLIKCVVAALNNKILQERLFAPSVDVQSILNDKEREKAFLEFHFEDEMFPLSFVVEQMGRYNDSWKLFFETEPNPRTSRIWCMKAVERFVGAKYEKNEDVLSDTLRKQLDNVVRHFIGAKCGLFCDVPMVHLWLELMLHQFGHSYHQNTANHRRYCYTAKTRKMCLDMFTFDKCRMLYDTLPLIEYLGSDISDATRQMITRMAIDAIDKHSIRMIEELYYGSALIGIGDEPWSDYHVLPKRVEIV